MAKRRAKKQVYEHPQFGRLPLTVHPTKPWRLVAYHGSRAVYETDNPAHEPEPEPVSEPEPVQGSSESGGSYE